METLLSSVEEKGDEITKIITFSSGQKKTFKGVKTGTIVQGQFTRFDLKDGRRIYVNDRNVDFFEVFGENPRY